MAMAKISKCRSTGAADMEALIRSSSSSLSSSLGHGTWLRHTWVHGLACIVALILGFSISREALLIAVSFKLPHGFIYVKTTHSHEVAILSFPDHSTSSTLFGQSHSSAIAEAKAKAKAISHGAARYNPSYVQQHEIVSVSEVHDSDGHVHQMLNEHIHRKIPALPTTHIPVKGDSHALQKHASATQNASPAFNGSRVHVGRHEILVRPLPHPDRLETLVAHRLIDIVQNEQQHSYGLKENKPLIVITPIYSKELKALQLTCLMHTLSLVSTALTWIVVEAGSPSTETAQLLSSSKFSSYYLTSDESLKDTVMEREDFETRLLMDALRLIRKQQLDGIVVFANASSIYQTVFFEEMQKVSWVGAFSTDADSDSVKMLKMVSDEGQDDLSAAFAKAKNNTSSSPVPKEYVVGWYASTTANVTEQQVNKVSLKTLEWSSLGFNAKILWTDNGKPAWVRSWVEFLREKNTVMKSPLDFVTESSYIESLGRYTSAS